VTTASSFIPDSRTTFVEIACRRAAEQPDRRAYSFLDFRRESKETHLTYKELHGKAAAIAAQLQLVADKGDRALLLYRPGLDFVSSFLGCLYAGIIAVPVAIPRQGQRAERHQRILADAASSLILTTEPVKRAVEGLVEADGLTWICTENLEGPSDWAQSSVALEDLAHLQYSSGSTGQPKGVMISHGNLAHQSAVTFEASGASSGSCCISWLPCFHDMGLIAGILQPLYGGYLGVLMAPEAFVEDPYRWLKAISDFRADVSAAPNFAYEMCVAKIPPARRTTLDLSSWRFAFTGAEPVRAKTIDEFSEAFGGCGFRRDVFFPAYGLAEATLMVTGRNRELAPVERYFDSNALEQNCVTAAAAQSGSARRLVGCGVSVPDQELAIVNPERLRKADAGEVGEIWIAGPSVGKGYWNNSEATAEMFQARISGSDGGPYLRTGDLGFVHDGDLFICGRLKDLILIRGRNHHAPDIEFSIQNCHPALRPSSTAAFPIQIDEEEQLVVVQEVDRKFKGSNAGVLDEIMGEIRRTLAQEHDIQPHAVLLVRQGTIPKTSSGKIQRRACRALYLANSLNVRAKWVNGAERAGGTALESADETSDRSRDIERWLIAQIATTLGRDSSEVRGSDSIAQLGLSEERLLQIARAAEIYLGRPLPTTILTEHPSIESTAQSLATTSAKQRSNANPAVVTASARQSGEESNHEPIAIVGIGCRFPGAHGPQAFWKMLCDGVDAVTEVPADRWDIDEVYDPNPLAPAKMNTRCGGFLENVDKLDRKFFDLSVREAVRSDPQHRLMMEVAWEALEDAGICPDHLSGSRTGMFVGISASDYAQMQFGDAKMTDAYAGLGCALTIAASRVSHFLNLRGPAIAVDTACSSSLSAIHLACSSIRKGECSLALAGGVNVLLSPIVTMCLTKAGMMASDGRCKAFDSRANGYVRSEGAGLVVLKPLSAAIAAGDPIYAVIRGSASNQDGRSTGISAPNGEAQEAVILAACQDAGVSPGELDYVEAHGTGTAVGDPIEAKALGTVLAIDRPAGTFCAIGSVKTNIGHAESAAGVASLIKASLILKHRQIPPSLHFENPNPLIPFESLPIRVQSALGPLPERSRLNLAGVNGFGVGGTNVHLVIEQAPQREATAETTAAIPNRPFVLPLSAKTPGALEAGAQAIAEMLRSQAATPSTLSNLCYSAARHRTHMQHRLAVAGSTAFEIADALSGYLDKGSHPAVATASRPQHSSAPRKLVFAFSGQGSQWAGMGCSLYQHEPVFRRTIEECHALFRPYTGWSLIDELTAPPSESRLEHTEVAQPALFALQVGLTELFRSWGIVPDAVLGHSAGEVAAAYASGALSLAHAARLIATRAKLMQQATGGGKMASIELSLSELEPLLAQWNDRLSIAAVNGPTSVVLSGEASALENLIQSLQPRGAIAVPLPVNYAFHSPQMEPYKDQLIRLLAENFESGCAKVPMFSTVTGSWCNGTPLDAHYWGANVRQPVLLANAIEGLAKDGAKIFVEIGPHPVISGAISRNLKAIGSSGSVIPSLRRDENEQRTLAMTLATLYTEGRAPDWKALHPSGTFSQSLPTYQWDRQRFWLDLPEKKGTRQGPAHPLLGDRLPVAEPVWQKKLDNQALPFLNGFTSSSRRALPGSVLTEIALAAASELFDSAAHDLLGIVLHAPLEVAVANTVPALQTTASLESDGEYMLRVFSEPDPSSTEPKKWTLHLSARAVRRQEETFQTLKPLAIDTLRAQCGEGLDGAAFYQHLEASGIHSDPSWRTVEHVWRGHEEAMICIRFPEAVSSGIEKYCVHPIVLEAAAQACRAAYGALGLQLELAAFQRLRVFAAPNVNLYAYARLRGAVERLREIALADLWLCDDSGAIVASLEGAQFKRRKGQDLVQVPIHPEQWLYDITWQPSPRTDGSARGFQGNGNWLVLADEVGAGQALAYALEEKGERCVLVRRGSDFARLADGSYTARASEVEDLRRIFAEELPTCRGVVHLWSTDADRNGALSAQSISDDQSLSVVSVRNLLEGIVSAQLPRPPRLWIVTAGAQLVAADSQITGLSQSTVWGLGKVIALEHPELKCCRVDLSSPDSAEEIASLFDECWFNSHEDQVSLRGDGRYVARLVRHALDGCPTEQPKPGIQMESRGSRRAPAAGEVEIRVSAAVAGGQCSGTVVRVGSAVQDLRVGDEVVSARSGAVAPYVTLDSVAAVQRPQNVSAAQAAASASAFLTAVYALRELARTLPGDYVLIHGAADGAGEAAVQVAKQLGAVVIATIAGDAEGNRLEVDHTVDCRALSFASDVLGLTAGRGVQVVFNCLPGMDAAHFLSALSTLGHYIDASGGRSGHKPTIASSQFPSDVSFHRIHGDVVAHARPTFVRNLFQEVMDNLRSGRFTALPVTTVAAGEITDALQNEAPDGGRTLAIEFARTTNAGPDVPEPLFHENATYLITGGLGGLGLSIAKRMIAKGVRQLVLLSRKAPSPAASDALTQLRSQGANVVTASVDVSDREQVKALLDSITSSMPPLRGIIHAAGILENGLLIQLNEKRFRSVMDSKITGAWHLHELTRETPLDFFVLFSSLASLIGSPGQGNYSAANAFLDGLAVHRVAMGLPALSVAWGPWAEVGMAADVHNGARLEEAGMGMLPPEEALDLLELLLKERGAIGAIAMNWALWSKAFPVASEAAFVSGLIPGEEERALHRAEMLSLAVLQNLAPADQIRRLEAAIHKAVCQSLQLDPAMLPPDVGLTAVGLDSIVSLELKNRLECAIDVVVQAPHLLGGPTVHELAVQLLNQMITATATDALQDGAGSAAPEPPAEAIKAEKLLSELDQLSDAQVSALLLSMAAET
jgi:phthiocerol/phenolphthiocerol synthesis type-I polyketide synthase C